MTQRRRQIPLAQQRQRAAQLDEIRRHRPLTDAEHAEADNLAHRAYMRAWQDSQREIESRLMGASQ